MPKCFGALALRHICYTFTTPKVFRVYTSLSESVADPTVSSAIASEGVPLEHEPEPEPTPVRLKLKLGNAAGLGLHGAQHASASTSASGSTSVSRSVSGSGKRAVVSGVGGGGAGSSGKRAKRDEDGELCDGLSYDSCHGGLLPLPPHFFVGQWRSPLCHDLPLRCNRSLITEADAYSDDAEADDFEDTASRRSGSPSKLTARQRAKGNKDMQDHLVALPNGMCWNWVHLSLTANSC